jgi:nitrogen-specific signal transduction histidine kinase
MSRPSRKKSPICADRHDLSGPTALQSPCLNIQGNPFAGLDLLSSAVVLLDARLAIRYLNPAAENLLEISNKVFAGCPLEGVMECPPRLLAALDSVLNQGWGYTGQKIGLRLVGGELSAIELHG